MRILFITVIISTMMAGGIVYCQEKDYSDKEMKFLVGQVSTVSWIDSTITVKYKNVDFSPVEITLTVPSSAEITKSGDRIGLSDIRVFDSVQVTYYQDDTSGGFKAVKITVSRRDIQLL